MSSATFSLEHGNVVWSSRRLEVVIDGATGAVRRVRNVETDQTLIDTENADPWRMSLQGASSPFLPFNRPPSFRFETIRPADFEAEFTPAGDVRLSWTTTSDGIRVEVDLRSGSDDELELWPRVLLDETAAPPVDFTYPVLASPKQLSGLGRDDCLAFPVHSGWLVRRPMAQPFPISAPYPDGYNGCSTQFLAYYEQARGGFYIATHDPHSTWKSFTFGGSEVTIRHDAWDLRRGADMDLDYPIVIAPLTQGDWYEAAERYRGWAIGNAPWCSGGPKREQNGARWLRDDVWVSLWCTPSSIDWSTFHRFYAEEFESPIHVVAGWDWPATTPHTVGHEGWFPARFHPANLEAWKGHYVTPYTNDYFISPSAEGFLERWEPNLVFPHSFFTFSAFSYPRPQWIQNESPTPDPAVTTDNPFYLCPATDAQRELHAWRDVGLARDYGLAGAFYDISSGNPLAFSRCLRTEHGHSPGRGRHLVQALETVNRASKDAVGKVTGGYFAQGTETIIENVIGSVDFYVSRAAAGPMGFLEAWTQGPEEAPGTGRELIPLFQSVYHDVGPVHEDGWIRLLAEEGDLFYWVAARIAIQWGGVMSIHYAMDPAERPPNYEGSSAVISWDGARYVFDDLPALDRAKVAFIRELGRARTTFANAYVSYGRIVRPVDIDARSIDLRFHQELPGIKEITNEGVWSVPRVMHGAWMDDATGRLGLMFVNLDASEQTLLEIDADLNAKWGIAGAGRKIVLHTRDGSQDLGTVSAQNRISISLQLPARLPVLVEVRA
ncbi:MAG: DUF6259 domain-containing protein [Actinomycetota bacterium]